MILDTESMNGTYINDTKIENPWTPRELNNNDKLTLGSRKFRVSITEELSPEEIARSRQPTIGGDDLPPLPVKDNK